MPNRVFIERSNTVKVKKRFRGQLNTIIFMVLVAVSSLVLLLGLTISFYFQERQLIEQATLMSEQIVKRSADALSAMFTTIEDTTYNVVRQLNLNELDLEDIHELLVNSTELNRDIESIVIFDSEGNVVDYSPQKYHLKDSVTLSDQKWYDPSIQFDQSLYSIPHVQNLFLRQYGWVISNTVPFRYRGERYILMIDFRYDMLKRFFERGNIGRRGYTFIVDKDNEIVYHPQQQLLLAKVLQEPITRLKNVSQQTMVDESSQSILVSQRIGANQWRVVGKTYIEDMTASARQSIIRVAIVSFAVLSVLIACLAYVSARYIATPIQSLAHRMNQSGKKILKSNVKGQANYSEAEMLNQSYNQLIGEVHHLLRQVKVEEAALRKMELNVLESQIQPHFLYNTLESILWMIERGDVASASKMVRALGTLFRNSLNDGREYTTLLKEFEHVRSYLDIQTMRYKSQFDYRIILPKELEEVRVVKLVVQPLVENAIYHGLSRMVDPGYIVIEAHVVEGTQDVCIVVRDNGLGIAPDRLKTLRMHLSEQQVSVGIGMSNVHQRLQIYYGEQYGMTIESELDEGTTVMLTIPNERSEQ